MPDSRESRNPTGAKGPFACRQCDRRKTKQKKEKEKKRRKRDIGPGRGCGPFAWGRKGGRKTNHKTGGVPSKPAGVNAHQHRGGD